MNGRKELPNRSFYPVFFTPPRWANAAFVCYKPARMRSLPAKPHPSARRAPRSGANGCADVRFLTCAAVQLLIFRPEAALGSGFSLQAVFWYQNAMLALFLRSKKSRKRSLSLMPPFRTPHIIWLFCTLNSVVATLVAMAFLRRICSSRPGDGEQCGQSLAALTARGRGLDCFQPQRMAACLASKQTAYLSTACVFYASTTETNEKLAVRIRHDMLTHMVI